MGRLAVTAAFRRDYPRVMALTVLVGALVILGNLLADVAYGFADPRIRYN
jgi:ABC-type dipeptide/oligopeptide/nickel transport system permease component